MSQTTSEVVWLEGLLTDLGVQVSTPITLYCDNLSAKQIAENPCFHERTKHLRTKSQKLDVHYIRDNVQAGFISISYVKSSLQKADIMTKALGTDQHRFLSHKIGLVSQPPVHSWLPCPSPS